MYCEFFQLRAKPFEDRADARMYCATPDHEEAIAAMEYAARYGKGVSMLLGEAGTGKTMLVRVMVQRLHATDHAVVLPVPTGHTVNILRDVAKGFGVTLPSQPTSRKCLARLRRNLIQRRDADHRCVLVLDQAENLTDDDLSKIAALSELRHAEDPLIEIILVAQPHFAKRLEAPEFLRMRQQAFGERVLRPLTETQTRDYVRHRISCCGAQERTIFTDGAIRAVHVAAGGNCRLINRICDEAMVAAYGANCERIDEAVIAEVVAPVEAGSDGADDRGGIGRGSGRGLDSSAASPGGSGRTIREATAPAANVVLPTADARPQNPTDDESRRTPRVGASTARSRHAGAENAHKTTENLSPLMATAPHADAQRVERLLRRFERTRSMQEASLTQVATLEAQLEELAATEERISTNIDGSFGRAAQTIEQVEARCQTIIRDTEARLAELEARAREAERRASEAEGRLAGIDSAVARGTALEDRLNAFAAELGDRVEQAQERVGLLMTGMDAGNDAYERLEGMAKQVNELVAQLEGRAGTERARIEQAVASAEQARIAIAEDAVARHRDMVLQAIDTDDRARIDTVKAEIERYHGQLRELLGWGRGELDGIGGLIDVRRREVDDAVTHCNGMIADLDADVRRKAGPLVETCEMIVARKDMVVRDVDELRGRIDRASEEVGALVVKTQQACDSLDQRMADAHRMCEETDRAARDASQVTERLVATIDEKSAQIGSLHAAAANVARQLADGTKSGHECAEALGRAREGAALIHEELTELKTSAQEEMTRLEQGLREAVDRGQSLLDEAKVSQGRIETVQRSVESSLVNVGSACARAAEIERTVAGFDAGLERMSEKQQAITSLLESAGALRESIETSTANAAASRKQLINVIDRCDAAIKEAGETDTQLGARHAAAKSLLGQLGVADAQSRETLDQITTARAQTERAICASESTRTTLAAATASAQDAEARIAASITKTTELVQAGRATSDQLETVHRSATAGLEQIGAACQRVTALNEQAKACERIVEELQRSREDGEALSANLSHTVADAHMVHDALSQILHESDDRRDALNAAVADGTRTTGLLREATGSAVVITQEIERAATVGRERAAELSELDEQTRSAVTQADGRIKTLTTLRTQVAEVVESANQKARETQSASERVTRLIEEVTELCTTSESRARELEERNQEAASTLEEVVSSTSSIEQHVEPIRELVRLAEQRRAGLEQGCTGAAQLVEKLEAVPGMIETATQSRAGLEHIVGRADSLQTRLTELTEQADRHAAALQELHEAAEVAECLTVARTEGADVLQRLERTGARCVQLGSEITQQADRIIQRVDRADGLSERIEKQEARLDAGNRTIGALADQVRTLAAGIKEMGVRSAKLEELVTRATARPQEIIAAAKQQADQLDTVCGAVRKVFAGLSQATIDSKKQKDAFEKVSGEASTRLSHLKTETDRAARTLCRWVEEATRAQARLADTLGSVPSLEETHGADALDRLADLAAGPIKSMPAGEGLRASMEVRHPNPSVRTSDEDEFGDADEVDPADEVARMIAEAKRAPATSR